MLLKQAKEIQKWHQKSILKKKDNKEKQFCRLMMLGKVSKAVALIKEGNDGGVHDISDSVVNILQDKHPKALKILMKLLYRNQQRQHLALVVLHKLMKISGKLSCALDCMGIVLEI